MNTQTSKYDAAEYIDSPELAHEYIKQAFDDGDPRLIRMAINDVARAIGMGKIASDTNLGRQSLYKSLAEDGNPSFETILKVIDALGMRVTVKENAAA